MMWKPCTGRHFLITANSRERQKLFGTNMVVIKGLTVIGEKGCLPFLQRQLIKGTKTISHVFGVSKKRCHVSLAVSTGCIWQC